MENDIVKEIEACWEQAFAALLEKIKDATDEIDDLLTLEEHYRTGHKSDALGKAMGGFGAGVIDFDSMAQVLGQGDKRRLMDVKRYDRVVGIREGLNALKERYRAEPPKCLVIPIDADAEKTLEKAEDHLNAMAGAFRLLRIASLEARAKYDERVHDDFFKRFNWEHLENDEVRLCPPIVVLADQDERFEQLSKILTLLSSGKPVKIVLRWSRIPRRLPAAGRSAALQCTMDIELLPVALRGAYVSQGTAAGPDFHRRLAKGLISPRPAVFSLFVPPAGRSPTASGGGTSSPEGSVGQNGFHVRAERAVSARVFPNFVYDPDLSADFVACFDLSGNPAMRRSWPLAKLKYRSEKGEPAELEREYTFADFTVWEEDFKEEFSPMPAALEGREEVHISKYLDLPSDQRGGKVPFVYSVDAEKRLIRRVPSMSMILQTSDRLALWRTLKELAGIENPHVRAAEDKIRAELTTEKEASLKSLREELDGKIRECEKDAIASAMRGLARRLAGMEAGSASELLGSSGAAAAGPDEPKIKPPVKKEKVVSDTPWIQSKKCTTCDECTNINPRIFAYDKDKRAYIANHKAGPFRDIVKAAKMCSAKIIHPGKPWDPNEKDLEKWIKQAEQYR